ncbi:MAG TPA: AbrB family transcriptional regulator [Xanthobacteraceae bacterium]|jgi:membrane AbrB-like protein|nr:AbrB family transcriptional regulator [Xanthobacteraceae bacterium]
MPPPDALPRSVLPVAETLLVASIGGLAFAWVGFPAGLISGSTLVTAVAALLGRPMTVPVPMSRGCFVLIGILLGAVVTPGTLRGIATWPLSIALLAMCAALMTVAATAYLRFVHGWEPLSALLGASPGSLGQAMALSAEFGADIRGIAIVQTVRVLLITLGLPAGLALFGLVAGVVPPSSPDSSWTELAIVIVASTATAFVMHKINFPGGLLFGAMAASALLHGSGFVNATLPWWLGAAAVVVMGGLTGARFANTTMSMLLQYLWAALGSAAVAIAVSSAFVLVVTAILPFRVADVVIAFAPGAQDTMMVLALTLHLDPVFVGAHHLTRFLIVTFSVALTARSWAPRD